VPVERRINAEDALTSIGIDGRDATDGEATNRGQKSSFVRTKEHKLSSL
jgi:hypothetical protein